MQDSKSAIIVDSSHELVIEKTVQRIRESLLLEAEKVTLPDRFIIGHSVEHSRLVLTDTNSGKQAEVPLYAFEDVRKVLKQLFD